MTSGRWITVLAVSAGAVGCSGTHLVSTDGGSGSSTGAIGNSGSSGTALTLTAIQPASGLTDGGTAVQLQGSGFKPGAVFRIGGAPGVSVTVVSAQEITGLSPPGLEGSADVVVVNPDQHLATLAKAFTYQVPLPTQLTYCNLQFPTSATGAPGAPLQIYGRVYQAGVTDQGTQGPGIAMQAGISSDGGEWTWMPATFDAVVDGLTPGDHANNEYEWDGGFPAQPGTYATAFRAQLNGGPWSYCETDGLHAALEASGLGSLTVQTDQISWCNLQFPLQATGQPGQPLTYYGRVYEAGVTDQGSGQGPGISMELGVGTNDGGWTWQPTTYNAKVANPGGQLVNDEYQATLTEQSVGTYYTAFRAANDGDAWSYCEIDGLHPTLDPSQVGTLIIADAGPPEVSWCNLQYPQQGTAQVGQAITYYGRVYQPGVTDQGPGQGPGITMQLGVEGDGGWLWQGTSYNAKVANEFGALVNDEYQASLSESGPGIYSTAFRAMEDGGPWLYCEVDGIHAAIDPTQLGTLTVSAASPPEVSWCKLQYPTQATGGPGAAIAFYGQVFAQGVTQVPGPGPGVLMQGGIGWPDGGWSWNGTVWDANKGNNDEYEWSTTDPVNPGTYPIAFEASLDGGPWVTCEADGPHATLDPNQVGTLTVQAVAPPTAEWCNLQFPLQASGAPGAPVTLYGQVYQPGLTGGPDAGAGVLMQAGLSQDAGVWIWTPAVYDGARGNNDEYQLATVFPNAPGVYQTAFRASLDGGPWVYCETDGEHATLTASATGSLTVAVAAAPTVGWCNLQYPQEANVETGQTTAFYGRVYEQGVTDGPAQGPGIFMELGLGIDGGWSWQYTAYNSKVNNGFGQAVNDEYTAPVTETVAGNYLTAFRAANDGGPWTYCEIDGPHTSLDLTEVGTLNAQAPAPPPPSLVTWCDLQFPTEADGGAGSPLTLYGQVYQPGITDQPGQGPGIAMQAGLNDLPDGGWNWSPAQYNVKHGNNDEYLLATDFPPAGTYQSAFRASLDGGPWTYCETNGPDSALVGEYSGSVTSH